MASINKSPNLIENNYVANFVSIKEHNSIVKSYQRTIYRLIADYEQKLQSKRALLKKLARKIQRLQEHREHSINSIFENDGIEKIEDLTEELSKISTPQEMENSLDAQPHQKEPMTNCKKSSIEEYASETDKINQITLNLCIEPNSVSGHFCPQCSKTLSTRRSLMVCMKCWRISVISSFELISFCISETYSKCTQSRNIWLS